MDSYCLNFSSIGRLDLQPLLPFDFAKHCRCTSSSAGQTIRSWDLVNPRLSGELYIRTEESRCYTSQGPCDVGLQHANLMQRLAFKDRMIQFNAVVLREFLHRLLHVILHSLPPTEELPDFTTPEPHIAGKEHKLEDHVACKIPHPLSPWQVRALCQSERRPIPGDLDSVNRGSQELIVTLDNAHVAANDDKLSRPFGLIAENLLDTRKPAFAAPSCSDP